MNTPNRAVRMELTNFRGHGHLVVDFSESGIIARGTNGAGKTTILRGLRAALGASDCTPDSVRTGADEATVVLSTSEWTVRRRIAREGAQPGVKVEAVGPGGVAVSVRKPQAFLDGQAPALDPLAFYLAQPKARREMVLGAMPIAVTVEQLRAWDPSVPDGYDCKGHGLEVLERRKAEVLAISAAVGEQAKEAGRQAAKAQADAEQLAARAPDGAPTVKDAEAALALAERARGAMLAALEQAEAAEGKSAGTRERIVTLRAKADEAAAKARELDPGDVLDDLQRGLASDQALVEELRGQLALAEKVVRESQAKLDAAERARRDAGELSTKAASLREQASGLEESLAANAIAMPAPDDLEAAAAAVEVAKQEKQGAELAAAARGATAAAKRAQEASDAAGERARTIARVARTLATDAQGELVASCQGLPGLGLSKDGITVAGVSVDGLCGLEQLYFAIDLSKLFAAKAGLKVLTIDGLERVAPEHLDPCVARCIEGGFQLIASYVDRGELRISEAEGIGETLEREAREEFEARVSANAGGASC